MVEGGVWWDRPKTIGRLGDIGFFTLKKGKYTLYTEEERVLGLYGRVKGLILPW